MEKLSFLNDSITLAVPHWPSLCFNMNIPLYGSFSLSAASLLFRYMFYFSIGATSYSVYRCLKSALSWVSVRFRSLYNAKKYLNPCSPITD